MRRSNVLYWMETEPAPAVAAFLAIVAPNELAIMAEPPCGRLVRIFCR